MSITLTEATITGGPLPTGVGYNYSFCDDIQMWYAFRIHPTTGVVQYQQLPTFPPTTFDNADGAWYTPITSQGGSLTVDLPADLSKWDMKPTHQKPLWVSHFLVKPGAGPVTVTTKAYSAITANGQGWPSFNAPDHHFTPAAFDWCGSGDHQSDISEYIIENANIVGDYLQVAVGGKMDTGEPAYKFYSKKPDSIRTNSHIWPNDIYMPLDSTKCTIVDSAVQCYGMYSTLIPGQYGYTPKVYFLLTTSGIMGAYGISNEIVYYQLTVPAGGVIRQFMRGYYIATDVTNKVFLYSINNNGTLIQELLGTYDPTLSLELFHIG
jgi:hypothetical protein